MLSNQQKKRNFRRKFRNRKNFNKQKQQWQQKQQEELTKFETQNKNKEFSNIINNEEEQKKKDKNIVLAPTMQKKTEEKKTVKNNQIYQTNASLLSPINLRKEKIQRVTSDNRYILDIATKEECEDNNENRKWQDNKCFKDKQDAICSTMPLETCVDDPLCQFVPIQGKCFSKDFMKNRPINEQFQYPENQAFPKLLSDPNLQNEIYKYHTGQLTKNFPSYQEPMPQQLYNRCVEKKFDKQTLGQSVMHLCADMMQKYEQPNRGILALHSLGSGKSLAKGTKVLMFDGQLRNVEDIKIGEQVMGDDSTPRNVIDLGHGFEEMFDIIPVKGEKYTVNRGHILCMKFSCKPRIVYDKRRPKSKPLVEYFNNQKKRLTQKPFENEIECCKFIEKYTEEDKTFNISLEEYLQTPKYLTDRFKGYRIGVNFKELNIDFDPYIIGVWLGDGTAINTDITTQSHTIIQYLQKNLSQHNLYLQFKESNSSGYCYNIKKYEESQKNSLREYLKNNNLLNNKHIPDQLKINSRNIRLKVLAGILDTDGYLNRNCYDIIQKSKQLADDIVFICRSLGFAAYQTYTNKSCIWKGKRVEGWYYRMSISGEGLEQIPNIVQRKKAHQRNQIKDALVTGIKVKSVGQGEYFGLRLDGNHKYLLGDFTVTHNTCTAAAIMDSYWNSDKKIYYITTYTNITNHDDNEFKDCLENFFPKFHHNRNELNKQWPKRKIESLSFQAAANVLGLSTGRKVNSIDAFQNSVLIIDEIQNIFKPISTQTQGFGELKKFFTDKNNNLTHLKNTHIYGLTATPGNTPSEIIQLINMLRGYNQPDLKIPIDQDGIQLFQKEILGMISYVDNSRDFTKFPRLIDDDIIITNMSQKQFEAYQTKMGELEKKAAKELDLEYLKKTNKIDEYYKTLRKYSNMLYNYDKKNMDLSEFSSKLQSLVDIVDKHPTQKHYIYSQYYFNRGTSKGQGIRAIAMTLQDVLGYEQITLKDCLAAGRNEKPIEEFLTKKKRFLLLLKTEMPGAQTLGAQQEYVKSFLQYFNDPKNLNGEYIQLLLTSQSYNEGLDLKDVTHIHIFEPLMSKSSDNQAMGRAARNCSHRDLKFPLEWVVYVHRYLSDYPINYQFFDTNLANEAIEKIDDDQLVIQHHLNELDDLYKSSYFDAEGKEEIKQQIKDFNVKMQNNNDRRQTLTKKIEQVQKDPINIPIDFQVLYQSQREYQVLKQLYESLQLSSIDCILISKLTHTQNICYSNLQQQNI